jgi:solute carrier family 35 protein F5
MRNGCFFCRGCFLTSTLTATLALTLQIPLSMVLDVVIRHKIYPLNFYLGSLPMLLALVFVAFLMKYDDSDPVLKCFKVMYRRLWKCRKASVVR